MGKGDDPNCVLSMPASQAEAQAAAAATAMREDTFEGLTSEEADLPNDWNTKQLNVKYVDNEVALQACVRALRHQQVTRVALDIETTGLKPWYGSIRLIQVGVELPEPKQFLIDCWQVDPGAIMPVLEDPQVEVITCNGRFEQTWLHYRYGVVLTNLFDVSYASKCITKKAADATRGRAAAMVKRVEKSYKEQLKELRKELRAATKDENALAVKRLEKRIAKVEGEMEAAVAQAKEQAPTPRKVASNFRLLMRRYTGKKISKTNQTSDWGADELDEGQRIYAAMDVAGLLDIRRPMGREIAEKELDDEVTTANNAVFDSSLRELESGHNCAHQFAQLARTMLHCRSVEQLDRMFSSQGQMTIHFSFRDKARELYERRRNELLAAA